MNGFGTDLNPTQALLPKFERRVSNYKSFFASTSILGAILAGISLNVVASADGELSRLFEAARASAARSSFLFATMLVISCYSNLVCTLQQDEIAETLTRMEAANTLYPWSALVFLALPSVLVLLLSLGLGQFFAALGFYGFLPISVYGYGVLLVVNIVGVVYFIRELMAKLRRRR
jgi:hypothetical protein